MKKLFLIFKKTFQKWSEDEASQLAAALAYYSIFSLVPLILLLVFLAGFFLKDQVIQNQIISFFQTNVGPDTAQTIDSMLKAFNPKTGSLFIQIIGFITLVLGATGVVKQLQYAFNKIWNLEIKPGAGVKVAVKKQFLAFVLIGFIGLLVLFSLLLSTGLSLILNFLHDAFPWATYLLPLSEFVLSFVILSLLFMTLFRYLPDAKLSWKNVWRGAILTGFLFLLGKFALSWYFTFTNVGSTYGAASSLIVLLLWIYYSSLILLFGVEFTQVYSQEIGLKIKPKKTARFGKRTIVITPPNVLQKAFAAVGVFKTEIKMARFFMKMKYFFSRKKPKK